MNVNQLKMLPKEEARLVHEMIPLLHLAARSEFSPNAIDYTPSDERTGYIDDTRDSYVDDTSEEARSRILGNVVGHRGVE
jgi:hypothetical protein